MLETEREEAARTFYVLRGGIAAVVLDQFSVLLSRPARYLKGLSYAVRMGGLDLKKCLYSVIYFAEAVRAGRWMMSRGATHFHSHFSTTVGLLIAKVFPLTMSATIHGPEEFVDPAGFYLPQKIAASGFVCAISCFGRSQIAQLVSYDLWDRLEVAPLGIDPSVYEPAPFRESPGTYEIICVGRLTPFKAQHVLLDSVHRLISEGRNIRLRLVGDGPDRASLEARIRHLNLTQQVIVEGRKNQTEVRELYRRADIFALASFAEGGTGSSDGSHGYAATLRGDPDHRHTGIDSGRYRRAAGDPVGRGGIGRRHRTADRRPGLTAQAGRCWPGTRRREVSPGNQCRPLGRNLPPQVVIIKCPAHR